MCLSIDSSSSSTHAADGLLQMAAASGIPGVQLQLWASMGRTAGQSIVARLCPLLLVQCLPECPPTR